MEKTLKISVNAKFNEHQAFINFGKEVIKEIGLKKTTELLSKP